MDKDKIIEVINKYYLNKLDQAEAWDIVEEYCIERGKEDDDKLFLFLTLCSKLQLFPVLLEDVFSYYRRNLGLIVLYKNTPKGKEILFIY